MEGNQIEARLIRGRNTYYKKLKTDFGQIKKVFDMVYDFLGESGETFI